MGYRPDRIRRLVLENGSDGKVISRCPLCPLW
jgi:hypothetical protein